jgi:predicted  nucleic acid-binding Zn-ribbon protein
MGKTDGTVEALTRALRRIERRQEEIADEIQDVKDALAAASKPADLETEKKDDGNPF